MLLTVSGDNNDNSRTGLLQVLGMCQNKELSTWYQELQWGVMRMRHDGLILIISWPNVGSS